MQTKRIPADLVVVGGGLAGTCAAITAARHGLSVALVQDRPVLGGNSSSEVRLWALGAAHSKVFTRFAREGGVIEELILENLGRNPEGNPVLWDPLLVEWVTREPNITLLLDTAAYEADIAEDGAIRSATAFCSQSQTTYVCHGPLFLDASGDGVIGFLAGAEFRVGREPRAEFRESMAPDVADRETLGDSLYFFTRNAGRPVRFVKPSFAIDIAATSIPRFRRFSAQSQGSNLWWFEYGGLLDTIYDHQDIKLHLWRLLYGIWDYIKNSGTFPDAENLTLEWVGLIPGKRESRRFIGDCILTEGDVKGQTDFPDSVATGGWSLDLHPAAGIYSSEPACNQVHGEGVYGIPFRCLYSRTTPNLFLAGRLISASHVAFGSTRVMATGAVMGQAVGVAAAICREDGCLPRDCARGERLARLRRRLLKADQYVLRASNDDPDDLARQARVTASSSAVLRETREIAGGSVPLDRVRGLMVPIVTGRIESIAFLADVSGEADLAWTLCRNDRQLNYLPNVQVAAGTLRLRPGDRQWITIPIAADVPVGNVWLLLAPDKRLHLRTTAERLAGVMSVRQEEFRDGLWWPDEGWNLMFRLDPAQPCWEAANVVDGYARPYILPHLWVSNPVRPGEPEWLQLDWEQPRRISEVRLALNSDLNRVIYNVQQQYAERVIPMLARDLRVQIGEENGAWTTVATVTENHQRALVVPTSGVTTSRLRVLFDATNGHDRAEVYEVRVY